MTLYLPEVENDYVLEFYNKIAKHFQQTRVYLWPCVKDFLERTDKNDIIGDIDVVVETYPFQETS